MILHEYRAHPRRHGNVKLMPYEDALVLGGFVSTAGYPEDTVTQILTQNTTKRLDRYPLHMNKVVLDFDDNDEAYHQSLAYCVAKGWGFTSYATGGRGYHIYISITPFTAIGANLQAGLWVATHFSGYDKSMYSKASGITRIPGTYHASTGRPMTVASMGTSMVLPDIREVPMVIDLTPSVAASEYDASDSGANLAILLEKHVHQGERDEVAFRAAVCGVGAGLPQDKLYDLLLEWNSTNVHPPLRQQEILKVVRSAQKEWI